MVGGHVVLQNKWCPGLVGVHPNNVQGVNHHAAQLSICTSQVSKAVALQLVAVGQDYLKGASEEIEHKLLWELALFQFSKKDQSC